jgi:hypothetical protein
MVLGGIVEVLMELSVGQSDSHFKKLCGGKHKLLSTLFAFGRFFSLCFLL